MPNIYSFLQTAYHFIKSLFVNVTKKMYRTAAVFVTGVTVVTVVAFHSTSFAGAGKNASAAPHEIAEEEHELSEEEQPEEEGTSIGTRMEVQLTASNEQGQRLIGGLLERNIQDELAKSALEIEVIEKEVLMQTQQAAQEAEEKERKERAVISYTEDDYRVLQRIVQAEAGVCDEKGKILVANVIINRVKNRRFPNNVTDVVYQRGQFSPVMDGSINTCKVTEETIDCVNRALEGEDYSDGALFFMNRRASASSNVNWFDGQLRFVMQHGSHEFFK